MSSLSFAIRCSCSSARNYKDCANIIAQLSAMSSASRRHHDRVSGSVSVDSTATGSSMCGEQPAKKRRGGSADGSQHPIMPSDNRCHQGSASGTGGVHSSAAGSSTGGVEPAKKPSVDSGSYYTDSETSSDDGSQHSIAPTSFLFTDVARVEQKLQGHIIEDTRHAPDTITMDDIDDVVSEVEPEIHNKPHLVRIQKTEWVLSFSEKTEWKEVGHEYIPLRNTLYDGCLTTLRRSTPRKAILKLFNVRIPECQHVSPYFVNQTQRADIAHTIFALLDKEKAPFLVIGNLGFALATLLRCLRQFDEKMA